MIKYLKSAFYTAVIVFAFSTQLSAQTSWGPPVFQPPTMAQVNAVLSRQEFARFSQMGMFRTLNYNDKTANYTFNFKVQFKDGTTKEVRSKIYADTSVNKDYLLFVNHDLPRKDPNRNVKIYVDQTSNISREGIAKIIKGEATDSCWRFQALSGQINAFSSLSDSEYLLTSIQLKNGPIVALTEANLKEMVGNDEDALKWITKKDYHKAIVVFNRHQKKSKENN